MQPLPTSFGVTILPGTDLLSWQDPGEENSPGTSTVANALLTQITQYFVCNAPPLSVKTALYELPTFSVAMLASATRLPDEANSDHKVRIGRRSPLFRAPRLQR